MFDFENEKAEDLSSACHPQFVAEYWLYETLFEQGHPLGEYFDTGS